MKAGTTTLFNDLRGQSDVFLPNRKEPHDLLHAEVLTPRGRKKYEALFRARKNQMLCGEASTQYTALPTSEGTAERALQVLGPDVKLIYLVRNPIDRTISHYAHAYRKGTVDRGMLETIRQHPRFLQLSDYGLQIVPWVETFSRKNISVYRFEDYVSNRTEVLHNIASFLGFRFNIQQVDAGQKYNVGQGNTHWPTWLDPVVHSSLARRFVDPVASPRIRAWVRWFALGSGIRNPGKADLATRQFIADQLGDRSKVFEKQWLGGANSWQLEPCQNISHHVLGTSS